MSVFMASSCRMHFNAITCFSQRSHREAIMSRPTLARARFYHPFLFTASNVALHRRTDQLALRDCDFRSKIPFETAAMQKRCERNARFPLRGDVVSCAVCMKKHDCGRRLEKLFSLSWNFVYLKSIKKCSE